MRQPANGLPHAAVFGKAAAGRAAGAAGKPVVARLARVGALAAPLAPLVDLVLTVSTVALGVVGIYGLALATEMGLIDRAALTTSLSFACPLVTMVQYVSPAPVVFDAVRKMSAANLPTQVFQSQAACNILGIAYGIQIANGAVLVTNMFGLVCQISYLSSEHFVQAASVGWLVFSLKMSLVFNCGLIAATFAPINLLGHAITLFNVVLFASPLTKLGAILRTRNPSSLPTGMTVIGVLNNGVWALYALMIQDVVVLVPSILGYLLSAFQVLVILWCRGSLPFDLAFLLLPCRDAGRGRRGSARGSAVLDVGA